MASVEIGKKMRAELERMKDKELKEIRKLMFGPASVYAYTDAIYRLDKLSGAIEEYRLEEPAPELREELNRKVPELVQKIKDEYSKSPDRKVKAKAEAFMLCWETRGSFAPRYTMT